MCIRDRSYDDVLAVIHQLTELGRAADVLQFAYFDRPWTPCLLYTSDAADERSSVDLGGRRIIKKKKTKIIQRDHLSTNTTRTATQSQVRSTMTTKIRSI